jgi:hypothetical protein
LAFLSFSFTGPTKKVKKELHEQIVQLIGNSSQSLNNINLDVDIMFTINNKSELVVVSVNSDNTVVDNFVKSKLNYKKVKVSTIDPGKIYRLPLKVVTS